MSSTTSTKRSEPILLTLSILAGLQMFLGSATTVSIVGENYLVAQYIALAMLAVGAAQGGIQFWLRGQVTPLDHVTEYVANGVVVAGPANDIVPEGQTVRTVGTVTSGGPELGEIDEFAGRP